jgi:hypothetical protein
VTARHLIRDVRPTLESEIVNRNWHPDVLVAIRFENSSINEPKP